MLLIIASMIYKLLTSKFSYRVNSQSVNQIDLLVVLFMFFIFFSMLPNFATEFFALIYINAILLNLGGIVSPIVQNPIVKVSYKTEARELFRAPVIVGHVQIWSYLASLFRNSGLFS